TCVLPVLCRRCSSVSARSSVLVRFLRRQPLSFEPVVERVDPVVATRALLLHAKAVPTRGEDVDLGAMTGCLERLVEADDRLERDVVVLRPCEKKRRKLFRDCRWLAERCAIEQRHEVGARLYIAIEGGTARDHRTCGKS